MVEEAAALELTRHCHGRRRACMPLTRGWRGGSVPDGPALLAGARRPVRLDPGRPRRFAGPQSRKLPAVTRICRII